MEGTMDIKIIEKKLDNNEKLTKEEEQFLMQSAPPPEDFGGVPKSGAEATNEGTEGKTPEEIQAEKDKVAADKKAQEAKDALVARAKAAGLPDTATEEEIKAAEEKASQDDGTVNMLKVEEQLAREEGKVDLSTLTKREQAYYHRMRREQKRAQKAEEERDAARFELSKIKKEKPAEEPKPEEEDPFKGKEDGDFLTVAEAKKLLDRIKKGQETKVKMEGSVLDIPAVQTFLKGCDVIAAKTHEDYADVMELTEEIINVNPDYQKQVVEAFAKGENPALKMYELIKADPEYAKLLPAAQIRVKARQAKTSDPEKEKPKQKTPEEIQKEKDAKAAEEAIEKNKSKEKTSGHAEGKDKIEGTDLTIEQIAAMTDREFAKLPRKVRERYLELYG